MAFLSTYTKPILVLQAVSSKIGICKEVSHLSILFEAMLEKTSHQFLDLHSCHTPFLSVVIKKLTIHPDA